jgi:hypothetical protein
MMDIIKKFLARTPVENVKVNEPSDSIDLEKPEDITSVNQDDLPQEGFRQEVCSFFYDTGKYGGVRYWCKDSKQFWLLSDEESRVPIKDMQHIERNCRHCFEQCPLFVMK